MTAVNVCAFAADAIADIPAPKTESTGTDWSFILMGGISAFLGALLYIWLGAASRQANKK